jgi:hypothetical protein
MKNDAVTYCAVEGCNIEMKRSYQVRCRAHAAERRQELDRARKEIERSESQKVMGTVFECAICKKKIIRVNWKQRYCKPCGRKANNDVHNPLRAHKEVASKKINYAGTTINLSYPKNISKEKREQLRMDALVAASQLPDYNPYRPERYIREEVI